MYATSIWVCSCGRTMECLTLHTWARKRPTKGQHSVITLPNNARCWGVCVCVCVVCVCGWVSGWVRGGWQNGQTHNSRPVQQMEVNCPFHAPSSFTFDKIFYVFLVIPRIRSDRSEKIAVSGIILVILFKRIILLSAIIIIIIIIIIILIFLRQTMSLGNTVLQLFCCFYLWCLYRYLQCWIYCTFTFVLSEVCVQCPIWLFSVVPWLHGFLVCLL